MVHQIPPEDLERIMGDAGIGEQQKAKLRKANEADEHVTPQGHGSTPLLITFDF